jgi:hypothetical protein
MYAFIIMQPNQFNQFNQSEINSVKNKELLWTTLQESGAFAGLPSDQFQPMHAAFDNSVQQASMSSMSLSDANKHVIRDFMQLLRSANQNANQSHNKKKKIEVVYRAEDLQTERTTEFARQLREKQAEMDSFLTLKTPTDVSFADSAEDKPIGGEMSQLIARELAARERELVQPKPEDIKKAQQWIGTDNKNTNAPDLLTPSNNFAKKSVSFSETIEDGMRRAPVVDFEETDIVLSKFKKISASDPLISLEQLYNKLIALEESMNAKHAEIMTCLNVSASVMQNQFNQ